MKRVYMVGAVLLIIGLAVGIYGIINLQTNIPDAEIDTMKLSGQLIIAHEKEGVYSLDAATGDLTTLYQTGNNSVLSGIAVSPDGSTLVMAYAPSPDGLIQFGYTSLYVMPANGSSEPELLVDGGGKDVIYNPVWAPDGATLYYVRSGYAQGGLAATLSIERVSYPGGESEVVVKDGFSPAISADGTKLAYIATDLTSNYDVLYIANIDGSNPQKVAGSEVFQYMDVPTFSPDGSSLVFAGDQKPFTNAGAEMITWLFGVQRASAHNATAADLWTLPVDGGSAKKLARILAQGIDVDYAPDGDHIAFTTTTGVYVMRANGSRLARVSDLAILSSIEWVP